MKRPRLVVFGTVAVVTAAIIGFVFWNSARASRRQSAEAQVVGFVATPVTWDEGPDDGQEKGHTLTFAWVDGENAIHPQTMDRITWYDPAKTYKVCYNPRKPTDWKLYESTHACGS